LERLKGELPDGPNRDFETLDNIVKENDVMDILAIQDLSKTPDNTSKKLVIAQVRLHGKTKCCYINDKLRAQLKDTLEITNHGLVYPAKVKARYNRDRTYRLFGK
jgi:uncharacterized protein YecE (DUF72 family)